MNSKWVWLFSQMARRIWFRATLFSIAAVATALISVMASPFIPATLPTKIGADAVGNILSIIASSMLTVSTFSLSTMVSAYAAATSNVTPRATRLVMEDSTTQNVLATFIGSFLFSLVGIILLTTGAYGDQGRLVLFVVTVGMIVLIVITLLRWIDHLSRLGRVTETTERVEASTVKATRFWHEQPCLGANALRNKDHAREIGSVAVETDRIGYVQHVDAPALSKIAEEASIDIAVLAIPGKLVDPSQPLAWIGVSDEDDLHNAIKACFTIGDIRSFDQDPRFGASVLTEIASRALSPAVNDPGTAIDVITRAMRILAVWTEPRDEDAKEVPYPRLHVLSLDLGDLFDDLFTPIARDGAGLIEVGLRLQKALASLAAFGGEAFHANALRHSKDALARAAAALTIDADLERLRQAAVLGASTV